MTVSSRDLPTRFGRAWLAPPFVIYLLGQLVSWTGNRINAIALPLLVIERYGIGLSFGLVAATRLVPGVLLGPFVGLLVDRLPRRATLIAAQLLSAGLVALIPITSELWQLYLLAALVGLAEVPMRAGGFAILPQLFPREALYRVNAAREVLDALSNLLGPLSAAAIIAAFGLPVLCGLGSWRGVEIKPVAVAQVLAKGAQGGRRGQRRPRPPVAPE